MGTNNCRAFFDAMQVERLGKSFHGKVWESGEARCAVSWAEIMLLDPDEDGINGVSRGVSVLLYFAMHVI